MLLSDFTTLPLGTDMGMDRPIQGLRDVTYFDFRLQHPFSCVISGPSNLGKTFFVKIRTKRFLIKSKTLCTFMTAGNRLQRVNEDKKH